MSDAIKKREIEVTFTLDQGGFADGTNNTLTITGHRVSCEVVSASNETGMMCALRIEGMKLSDMNRLSVIQAGIVSQSQNTVSVKAGNRGEKKALVFIGGVIEAFADFSGAPNVAFIVNAQSTVDAASASVSATAFGNDVPVATILETIAGKIGFSFRNYGITSVLKGGVTYKGCALEQIAAVQAATRIQYHLGFGVLSAWPAGVTSSTGSEILEISSSTGLIGYPSYSQYGVTLRTVFNPEIAFHDTFKLSSQYSPAAWVNAYGQMRSVDGSQNIYPPSNGQWVVLRLQHDLQTEEENGSWFTFIEAARPEIAGQVSGFAR